MKVKSLLWQNVIYTCPNYENIQSLRFNVPEFWLLSDYWLLSETLSQDNVLEISFQLMQQEI